jgi:hypothetical protein
MAKVEIPTNFQIPDVIEMTFVREDFLQTSNTYRKIFEVCLGLFFALLGAILEIVSDKGKNEVPLLDWLFLFLLLIGCGTFLILSEKNYNKTRVASRNVQASAST